MKLLKHQSMTWHSLLVSYSTWIETVAEVGPSLEERLQCSEDLTIFGLSPVSSLSLD